MPGEGGEGLPVSTSEGGVEEFRYEAGPRWIRTVAPPIVIAALVFGAAAACYFGERAYAGWNAFLAALVLQIWLYDIMLLRRAYIRLDSTGIVIRRPLGSERRYTWDQVRDVLFPYRPLGMPLVKPLGRVRVNGAKLDLAYYTDRTADAAQAIITRAGLTQQRRTRAGTVHERPGA